MKKHNKKKMLGQEGDIKPKPQKRPRKSRYKDWQYEQDQRKQHNYTQDYDMRPPTELERVREYCRLEGVAVVEQDGTILFLHEETKARVLGYFPKCGEWVGAETEGLTTDLWEAMEQALLLHRDI